ncbi:MAG: hypothetical protein ABII90_07690, partial [Bacteroidota bacterium]
LGKLQKKRGVWQNIIKCLEYGGMIKMACNERCRNASKDKKCKCTCNGIDHGKYSDNKSPGEVELDIGMGGEVAKFVQEWGGQTIQCLGICRKFVKMNTFMGYPHDAGMSDAKGDTWWVYFKCPNCSYGHSGSKMKFFKRHTEIERLAAKNTRLDSTR